MTINRFQDLKAQIQLSQQNALAQASELLVLNGSLEANKQELTSLQRVRPT